MLEKAEEKRGQTFIRGEYFNSNLSCPAIKTFLQGPLLNNAANYLGGKTVYKRKSGWVWLFCGNGTKSTAAALENNFH